MTEVGRHNQHPLNRLAKKKLREAKEYPDPSGLYSVQLMSWGLESGKVDLGGNPGRSQLEATVWAMAEWKPGSVMTVLTREDGEGSGEVNPVPRSKPNPSPRDLAFYLIDAVHMQMMATITNYPTADELR